MNIVAVGPEPTQVTCPSCRATVLTKIEHKATTRTHVVALVLCLFLLNRSTSTIQPVQEQPSSIMRTTTEVEYEPGSNTAVAPYGPPIILGPIPPSGSKDHIIGPQPTIVICHMCHQEIRTVIFHRSTLKTHLIAACFCILGCWCFTCVPYCMHSCHKTDHYCPYCSAFIGSYYID